MAKITLTTGEKIEVSDTQQAVVDLIDFTMKTGRFLKLYGPERPWDSGSPKEIYVKTESIIMVEE